MNLAESVLSNTLSELADFPSPPLKEWMLEGHEHAIASHHKQFIQMQLC
jgi:hypothetical protein